MNSNNEIKRIGYVVILFILLFVPDVFSATIYVDRNLQSSITNGSYSILNRNNSGSDGNAYTTIQAAINACSPGDIIYMRGGTYYEHSIIIPNSKGGNAGNHTTLSSYPGEWAIIDANGTNVNGIANVGWNLWPNNNAEGYLRYFTFERFELTGANTQNGFYMKTDTVYYRYLYIHDIKGSTGDGLKAGLFLFIPQNTLIEYCYFKDNENGTGAMGNNANIIFDADQRDSTANNGDGLSFDPNACIKNNTIRYNYLVGSKQNFRHKNQQRFGYNSRNPNDRTYRNYGDKIHHNIALGSSIIACQDYTQIYNNITDRRIHHQTYDIPIIYNNVIYNNTVLASGGSFDCPAGVGESGTTMKNYYDNGSNKTVHGHAWYYNNISQGTVYGYYYNPFVFYFAMPGNSSTYRWDMSDIVVERNFIHESVLADGFTTGRDTSGSGCGEIGHTTAEFNSCSATWRGVGQVINWENDNSGLFIGTSGSNQYKTNGSFILSGSTTISNGGKGGNHPYLDGVAIPSYIGAVDPNNSAWVDTVLGLPTTLRSSDENPIIPPVIDTTPPSAPSGVGTQIIN